MTLLDKLVAALASADLLESASIREFAGRLGVRPDKFYEMNAGKRTVNYDTLSAIKTTFPRVDANFLLTNNGEVLLQDFEPVTTAPVDTDELEDLRYQVKYLTRRCRELEQAKEHITA